MKILLDEDVPIQVRDLLRRVLYGHAVDHVEDLRWKNKKDPFVVRDAAARGYAVFVTNNRKQLVVPEECRAIKESGLHHVLYDQAVQGLDGLALAIAAIIAAMPRLVRELDEATEQRLAKIRGIRDEPRYTITDPQKTPPSPYWR